MSASDIRHASLCRFTPRGEGETGKMRKNGEEREERKDEDDLSRGFNERRCAITR